MYGRESIVLQRDVNIVQIPDGTPSILPKGHIVTLFQSLGGNYTVTTDRGHMVRIAGEDADALGKEPPSLSHLETGDAAEAVEMNAWEVMKTVYDPEIPVNIVDLGLVYDCKMEPIPGAKDSYKVEVKMTLTAPGCGMGPTLQQDVQNRLLGLENVDDVDVQLVWEPQWNQSMLTEAAKLQLGLL